MLAFQVDRHDIGATAGGSISRTGIFGVPRTVRSAGVALDGLRFECVDEDRGVHRIEADVDGPSVSDDTVSHGFQFALRDHSGSFDDAHKGHVQVLIIAELED